MPAPRRNSDRGDRRRRQILDAALAEIRMQPVADVQLLAIAARAGLGASHALYYFGSRDGVLVAAVAHAEQQLAAGRSERLGAIDDPIERIAAFVETYLPDDRHDPVWKLWFEGWLRSSSRSEFGDVGSEADRMWLHDLVDCLDHLTANDGGIPEPAPAYARRFLFLLDGLAVHVLADHIAAGEAKQFAMTELGAHQPR
jgi:AcrR family transcriptional regulator